MSVRTRIQGGKVDSSRSRLLGALEGEGSAGSGEPEPRDEGGRETLGEEISGASLVSPSLPPVALFLRRVDVLLLPCAMAVIRVLKEVRERKKLRRRWTPSSKRQRSRMIERCFAIPLFLATRCSGLGVFFLGLRQAMHRSRPLPSLKSTRY